MYIYLYIYIYIYIYVCYEREVARAKAYRAKLWLLHPVTELRITLFLTISAPAEGLLQRLQHLDHAGQGLEDVGTSVCFFLTGPEMCIVWCLLSLWNLLWQHRWSIAWTTFMVVLWGSATRFDLPLQCASCWGLWFGSCWNASTKDGLGAWWFGIRL